MAQADQAAKETTEKVKFHFRPVEIKADTPEHEKSAATGELKTINGKPTWKRAPFEATIPAVNEDDLMALLNDEAKGGIVKKFVVKLCNDATYEKVSQQVRDIVKRGAALSQEALNLTRVDLYNLAKYSGGIQIPKDLWDAWKADYLTLMQPLLNKPIEKISTAAGLIMGNLVAVEAIKDMEKRTALLSTLGEYVNTWYSATSAENQEKFLPIMEMLSMRFEALAAPDDDKELELDDIF